MFIVLQAFLVVHFVEKRQGVLSLSRDQSCLFRTTGFTICDPCVSGLRVSDGASYFKYVGLNYWLDWGLVTWDLALSRHSHTVWQEVDFTVPALMQIV